MKPEISETSYGFALTHELINELNVKHIGAPTFPTLKQEGSAGGGYDVKIPGYPLFLQFKLSEYLSRKNALDYKYFKGPYYRFKIWSSKNSMQHQLLLELERKYSMVYYAAPKFHTARDFNKNFVDNKIIRASAFLEPSEIGVIPDSSEHSVSFQAGNSTGIFRSEPREIRLAALERGTEGFVNVSTIMRSDKELPTFETFIDQLTSVFGATQPLAQQFRDQRSRLPAAEFARFTALSLFGTDLLYVE